LTVPLPQTFNLTIGWNNISYLYSNTYVALDNDGIDPPLTGIFDVIRNDVLWIKGPEGRWTMSEHGNLELEPGKGLFIKMHQDADFTYNE